MRSARKQAESAAIIGGTKSDVDRLLCGWSSRKSALSTKTCSVTAYETDDVKMLVFFKLWSAVGVGVVDLPGAGRVGISDERKRELIRLITGGATVEREEKFEGSVRREFYCGDTESDG